MSLAEIQKAIEALAPEEQEEKPRDWLNGRDPAMDREWAAIAQERIRHSVISFQYRPFIVLRLKNLTQLNPAWVKAQKR